MKEFKKTLEIHFNMDDIRAELESAIENFALDAATSDSPESLASHMLSCLESLQDDVQIAVDALLEEDFELEPTSYLDDPSDEVTTSCSYDNANQLFNVTFEGSMTERAENTDFNRLIEVLNDIGLNMADKTAILKIAKDAGVE